MAETNSPATQQTDSRPRKKKRERATDAVLDVGKKAKRRADDAAQAAVETFDQNPFGALAGAIAVGAVAAAMIPATRRELEALGPWTDRMREALVDAFDAAKDAGTGELTAAGLTLAAASDGVGGLVGKIVKAATVATAAAATTVKDARRNNSDGTAPTIEPGPPPATSVSDVATTPQA